MPFTRVVYIESTDFRQEDSTDYYGLAPGKAVMLRWALRWHGGGLEGDELAALAG